MAPVFAYGQLRLYLLALLESGPKHGYELITALSDRTGGMYRPSPGTVYPRLARLEEEGLVERTEDGRKGTYALTDAGRSEVAARRGELAALEEDLAETVRGLAEQVRDDVRGSMSGLRADLAAAAQEARARAVPVTGSAGAAGDARTTAHVRRIDAEAMVLRFRDEVRADLRQADARGRIDELTVETIRAVLDSALTAVRATLR
ncbi:PadR family transcriptional regulator [Pengzhenrongella frigida]|uniref:PadR family transcriptional regulator n=1 Tax=Pengzhenrongella frigida TaxID=1259133 RepID=A0A4Q5MZ02_9MICO|nr:PadR family transcriptional regulator [Cellulomonas sp. HLT2-17]RYV50163.1 PadR family transcriptional regulator [Cellulomonas sp. HLT2-17]